MNEENQLQIKQETSVFDSANFDHAQRVAKMLSTSSIVPKEYVGNIQNTMIALEMAHRVGASPLMVMQNLYIVHGKPSWSSTFIIASLNACKKFSPIRFEISGEKETLSCFAWAYELSTKEKIVGPTVTMAMAKAEGWVDKAGSKWKTMPELMIRYRAAAFFGRLYAPEIMMGMQTKEEVQDIQFEEVKVDKELERLLLMIADCKTAEEVDELQEKLPDTDPIHFAARKEELLNGRK